MLWAVQKEYSAGPTPLPSPDAVRLSVSLLPENLGHVQAHSLLTGIAELQGVSAECAL